MADPDPQLKDLQNAVAGAAPLLARALGTPNMSIAIAALGKSLTGDAQATVPEILKAAKAKDQAIPLQIIHAEQETQLRLGQSQPNLTLADLDLQLTSPLPTSAALTAHPRIDLAPGERQRQVKLHDETNKYLAFVVTLVFFSLLALLIFFGNRIDNSAGAADIKDLLFTLFGVVATVWASIIGFYFGSSSGSQQKSQVLNTLLLRGAKDR